MVAHAKAASCWRAARSTRRRCSCARTRATAAAGRPAHVPAPDGAAGRASTTEPIEGFYGAPQSVAVHHFARSRRARRLLPRDRARAPDAGRDRVPRLRRRPPPHAERLPYVQATIALLIDGHHDDPGGEVSRQQRRPHQALAIRCTRRSREAAIDAHRQHGAPAAGRRRARGDDAARDADHHPQRGRHRAHRRRAVRRQPATRCSPPIRWAAARWATTRADRS